MVTAALLARDSLSWVSPSPTWGDMGDLSAAANRREFLRPAVLRFAHDGFMDEMQATLAHDPQRLGEWRALPETWETPMPAPPTAAKLSLPEPVSQLSVQLARLGRAKGGGAARAVALPGDPTLGPPLKLYQPTQMRHYLVTASLVCQRPGLPDRRVDAAKQERAAFVLRRILLPEGATRPAADSGDWDEHAFVATPRGMRWQPARDAAGSAARVLPGEERTTLFSIGYDDTPERKRRVFGGVIPVGRREAYVSAAVEPAPASPGTTGGTGAGAETEPAADPRRLLFQMQVTGPWSELVEQTMDAIERDGRRGPDPTLAEVFGDPPAAAPGDESTVRAREQAQTISWYALLDFERFLFNHAPGVHQILAGTRPRADAGDDTEEPLLAWLEGVTLDGALGSSPAPRTLLAALTTLAADSSIGEKLEAVDVSYASVGPDPRWPAFRFPLADVGAEGPFPFTVAGASLRGHAGGRDATLAAAGGALEDLADLVERALPPATADTVLPEIVVQSRPQFDSRVAWFAIRCVYERPNCGPFDPPVVSEPSRPFQMAGFFDPEAPARPVRIPLPFDISPAGLRKYPKSATLMISDMLCGHIKKIRKLTLGDLVLSVLPWPFHKDLPNPGATGPCKDGDDAFGMFCSLSIPIVTLCALILLIIIVSLFDIFFHWLPLLFFCFPLKLSGKRK